jgi:protein gp37
MSSKTTIEWTESTWNPLTGCDKISPGCRNCYAERMAKRLKAMGQTKYQNSFRMTLHPESLDEPLKVTKPQMIFVNSMSDLFHKDVPIEFVIRIFDVMQKAYWHTFQILTKRAERLLEVDKQIPWPNNVWMGVSIENSDYMFRIEHLRQIHAKTIFLSLEPLLGPLPDLNLTGINWVIVGGESGPGARPIQREWVTDIRDQCQRNRVPFFFKQWGGLNRKRTGRLLDGRLWDELPQTIAWA